MKSGPAFFAEFGGRLDRQRAAWAEEVWQGQPGPAVLAEFSWLARASAIGAFHRLRIARRAETGDAGGRRRLLPAGWQLRSRLIGSWTQHIGRHRGRNGVDVELWGLILLFDLSSLGLNIHLVLKLRHIGA